MRKDSKAKYAYQVQLNQGSVVCKVNNHVTSKQNELRKGKMLNSVPRKKWLHCETSWNSFHKKINI